MKAEMRNGEAGSALMVALVAIVILLPITLLMAGLALRWQKESAEYRQLTGQEFAAQAGLAEAIHRLSNGKLGLGVNQATSLVLERVAPHQPLVRIARLDDVVLTLDGTILPAEAATSLDLEQVGFDADGRAFYLYRELELYAVTVNVSTGPSRSGVRIHALLSRTPEGEIKTFGVDTERGYFDTD